MWLNIRADQVDHFVLHFCCIKPGK